MCEIPSRLLLLNFFWSQAAILDMGVYDSVMVSSTTYGTTGSSNVVGLNLLVELTYSAWLPSGLPVHLLPLQLQLTVQRNEQLMYDLISMLLLPWIKKRYVNPTNLVQYSTVVSSLLANTIPLMSGGAWPMLWLLAGCTKASTHLSS